MSPFSGRRIEIPVSVGELIDKITILEIKVRRLEGRARGNAERELELLGEALAASGLEIDAGMWRDLRSVNETLWAIEDDIRDHERRRCFDGAFIELARSVYLQNDRRARIKKEINESCGSAIVEEKSYQAY
jgi:hypothetical protein